MVDSAPNIDPTPPPDPAGEKKPGFLSTRNGKIVVGAVVLFVVLLIAAGAVAFFLINGVLNQAANQTAVVVKKTTTTTTSTTGSGNATNTATSTPVVNPPEKPLSSTFTFRNVFAPSVTPVYPTTPSSGTSSSTGTTTTSTTSIPTEPNTLFLMSISTVNGEKQATFAWNGVLYTVGEGDQVDDSPWKVQSIGTTSVVMLFGDEQVTLTVGQGQSK